MCTVVSCGTPPSISNGSTGTPTSIEYQGSVNYTLTLGIIYLVLLQYHVWLMEFGALDQLALVSNILYLHIYVYTWIYCACMYCKYLVFNRYTLKIFNWILNSENIVHKVSIAKHLHKMQAWFDLLAKHLYKDIIIDLDFILHQWNRSVTVTSWTKLKFEWNVISCYQMLPI